MTFFLRKLTIFIAAYVAVLDVSSAIRLDSDPFLVADPTCFLTCHMGYVNFCEMPKAFLRPKDARLRCFYRFYNVENRWVEEGIFSELGIQVQQQGLDPREKLLIRTYNGGTFDNAFVQMLWQSEQPGKELLGEHGIEGSDDPKLRELYVRRRIFGAPGQSVGGFQQRCAVGTANPAFMLFKYRQSENKDAQHVRDDINITSDDELYFIGILVLGTSQEDNQQGYSRLMLSVAPEYSERGESDETSAYVDMILECVTKTIGPFIRAVGSDEKMLHAHCFRVFNSQVLRGFTIKTTDNALIPSLRKSGFKQHEENSGALWSFDLPTQPTVDEDITTEPVTPSISAHTE